MANGKCSDFGIEPVTESPLLDCLLEGGTGGTRAPSVKESALCTECLDFELDFDAERLRTGGGAWLVFCLFLVFLLTAFAVAGALLPCQDCRPIFEAAGDGKDFPGAAVLGRDALALGFVLVVLGALLSLAVDSIAFK